MEVQQTPLRTAIMRIMSDMLDSEDEFGIYETSRFMDRIEQLLCDMMVAPDVCQLSGSEAVFGFMAWLTTRNETTVLGPYQDVDISLVERFIEANNLKEPREAWAELLTHPPEILPETFNEVFDPVPDLRDPEEPDLSHTAGVEYAPADAGGGGDDIAAPEPERTIEFTSVEVFKPFDIDLSIALDVAAEILPIPKIGSLTKGKGKFNHPLGTVVVEGSIEQIVEFIVKNGLHKLVK